MSIDHLQGSKSLRRSFSPSLLLLSGVIFLLALLPRLGALDRYVTPDELHWVDRSIRFSQALSRGDLASTIQAGHPGVTTMWLGSLGLTAQRLFNPAAPVPGALPEFSPQDADAMRYLAQFLTPLRWPVILVTSFNLVLLFWLLSRVIDRRAAFLASALVALDPFAVALGGILHVDSLLMTFSLASLAALVNALQTTRSTRWLIGSGVLAGLAMLSKSPAIVLVPTAGLVITLDAFHKRAPLGTVIRSSLIWGLSAAFIFIALYPAMWAAPVKALQKLTETAEKHSETAHAVNFFFGQSERDPGAAFYPVVAAFRSTPVLWLGLIAALILIVRAHTDHERQLRGAMWPYWVFAVVFLGMVTLVAKKLDRYVLPTLEALNVIGALGLAFVIDLLDRRGETFAPESVSLKRSLVANASPLLVLIVTAAQFLAVWPLTLRAYNPLLGGYAGASAVLPAGGGESAEVARQLNDPIYSRQSIAATDIVGTAPFFPGKLWPATILGFARSNFLLFNASDVQLTPDMVQTWTAGADPIKTFTVQGQPYAWLYANTHRTADLQRLLAQRQPGDALLADEDTLPDTTLLLREEFSAPQAIELIKQLAASHTRVFVYHFASQPDRNTLELFRALDTYAVNLDQWSSPLSQSALYALPDPTAFTAQPLLLNGNVTFGDRIHLSTIQTVLMRGQPGQAISFVSQWQATGADAQLSVSLLDDAGHVWSTGDTNVPIGALPGSSRQRRFTVPVPLTIPPGDYRLVLNVIDVASGTSLLAQAAGRMLGRTDWPLGTITIDPAQTRIDLATRIPPIAINANLGGVIRAIGSDQPPAPVISGDPWTLSMEWTALTDHLPALDVQWRVMDAHDTLAYSITLPLNPYSTENWRQGDVLQSKYDFRVPITLEPGQYRLDFLVLDRATRQPLEPRPTHLTTLEIAARSRAFTAPPLAYPTQYHFDQLATLLGANTDRAGNTVTVTLYWKANAITATNYTVFVQITRPDGQAAGQIDRWQIGGDAPTAIWAVDQIIADAYTFAVPSGEYQVWAGVYQAADGQRLPAYDAAGKRVPEDKVLVLTLK